MSSAGRVANLSGCVARPRAREIGLIGFAAQIQRSSLTGSYVMETAEHREPCESRGSRTVLGARGGESPPRDSTSPSPLRIGVAGVSRDRAQDWIVGVALLRAAIERLAMKGAERRVEVQPGYEVRVADEGLAEGNEISAPLRDSLVGALLVEAVIRDEDSTEEPLDRKIIKWRNRDATRIALDHVEISEISTGKRCGDVVEEVLRIAVGDVVLP